MHNTNIKEFIREYSHLFWYTPDNKKEEISEAFLVETILNYGDMQAVKKLFRIMGIEKTADVFFKSINTSKRRKGHFHPATLNYFTLLFKRYAHRNT